MKPDEATSTPSLRTRAEHVAAERFDSTSARSEAEVRRMVHELQVHQIELEMQNDELQRARAELETSRADYQALYEYAPVGYLTLNEAGVIVAANLTAETLLGLPRSELIDRPLAVFVSPDDQDTYYQRRRALFGGAAHLSWELKLKRPDGSVFWADLEASALHDSSHESIAHVALSDVTRRKAADDALATAQRLESIGLLAAGIAHDFNNVLAVIVGNLSMLGRATPAAEQAATWIREAETACSAGRALATQLLTFAAGGAPVTRVVDLRELVTSGAGLGITGSTVRRELQLGDTPLVVRVDPDQIVLVLQNLTVNAMSAMPAGGVVTFAGRQVRFGAGEHPSLPPGTYVELTVEDQGPGVPPELVPRLFSPYFTTRSGGHGLGLATALSVMRRHRGLIAFTPGQPGSGARFTLLFPAVEPGELEVVRPPEPPTAGRGRVLLMDDEALVLKVLARVVRELGYEVSTARHGEEAIALWRAEAEAGRPFDVALMDLTIVGGMGGRETMARLLEVDPRARAIVCSGYSADPVMADHKDYGFSAALKKPFTMAQVGAALREVLLDAGAPATVKAP